MGFCLQNIRRSTAHYTAQLCRSAFRADAPLSLGSSVAVSDAISPGFITLSLLTPPGQRGNSMIEDEFSPMS